MINTGLIFTFGYPGRNGRTTFFLLLSVHVNYPSQSVPSKANLLVNQHVSICFNVWMHMFSRADRMVDSLYFPRDHFVYLNFMY